MDTEENITYSKILIINLGGIGDLLLSTPAIKALRTLYPQAEISMLITPNATKLLTTQMLHYCTSTAATIN